MSNPFIFLSTLEQSLAKRPFTLLLFIVVGMFLTNFYSQYIVTPEVLKRSSDRLIDRFELTNLRQDRSTANRDLQSLKNELSHVESMSYEKQLNYFQSKRLKELPDLIRDKESDLKEIDKDIDNLIKKISQYGELPSGERGAKNKINN